jgi:Carboxypeptidase regulatory-like domain
MPSDERDRQFERALQRHMRGTTPDAACPDAETLAAYHERTLSLEDLARWKEHIGGCARCQETLALVEETNSVILPEAEEITKLGTVYGSAANLPAAFRSMREEVLDEAAGDKPEMMAAAPASMPKKVAGRASWRWMAAAGALAAGLLVFVVIREGEHPTAKSQPAVQVAGNRESAPPMAKQKETAQEPKREEQETPKSDSTLAGQRDTKAKRSIAPADGSNNPAMEESASSYGYGKIEKDELRKDKGVNDKVAAQKDSRVREQAGADLDAARSSSAMAYSAPAAAPVPAAAPPPKPAVTGGTVKNRNEVAPAPAQGVGSGARQGAGIAGGKAPAVSGEKVLKVRPSDVQGNVTADAAVTPAKKDNTGLSTITGTVVDPSGAAVGGALITAVDTTNGKSRTAVADDSGTFRLGDLPTDQYRVSVAHQGFSTAEQTLTLQPRREEELLVQLKIGEVSETVEVTGATATLQTESTEVKTLPANGRNSIELMRLAVTDPRYIATPDRKIVWRVGGSGKIERTADQGKTWKSQVSGVVTDLASGSAPTETICWLVGKAGTLLRTIDGGKHWTLIETPLKADLGGVHAVDALHANIWNVANNKSFQTADGGVTWTPAANE